MANWEYDQESDEYYYLGYKGPFDDIYLVLTPYRCRNYPDASFWSLYLYDDRNCAVIGNWIELNATIEDVLGAQKEALEAVAEHFPKQIEAQQQEISELAQAKDSYERNIHMLDLFLKNITI